MATTAAKIQEHLARKYPGLEVTARKVSSAKITHADDPALEGTSVKAYIIAFSGKTAGFTEIIPADEIYTAVDAYTALRYLADDLAYDEGVL